jgi:hypothetical protein
MLWQTLIICSPLAPVTKAREGSPPAAFVFVLSPAVVFVVGSESHPRKVPIVHPRMIRFRGKWRGWLSSSTALQKEVRKDVEVD